MAFSWASNRNITARTVANTSLANNLPSTPAIGSVLCATFIWFDGAGNSAGTLSIKDTNNNAFTLAPSGPADQRPTTAGVIYNAYLIAPSNITNGFSATWTNSGVCDFEIEEFSVSGGTAVFDTDTIGTGSSGTSITSPTIGAASGSMIFASGAADHQVSTVDSPFTQVLAGTANQFSEGVGYLLSGSGSTQITMTMNVSSGWAAAMMAFKISSGVVDGLEWMQKSQVNQLAHNYAPIIIPVY